MGRTIIGFILLLAGLYFFWPALSLGVFFGALLIGGGVLYLRSGVTGKELLSSKERKLLN